MSATLCEIMRLALPIIAGYVVTLVNELTNTVCVGHAGDDVALAAVGLGNMMQNCVALSVGFGVGGALDTLVSQAYGAQQHQLCCHYFQRCRVLMTLQLVWMVPVLWFSETWLTAIHQDAAVSQLAGRYNRASVWGLFALFQFEAQRKFLQNRGKAVAPAVITAVTGALHVGWCVLFVVHLRLGNAGAGLANVVTWWTQFLLTSTYLARMAGSWGLRRRSLLWIEREGLRGWWPYIRLALPSTVQLCAEWWFWELCALVVGYLGPTVLAAHVSALNWVAMVFMPVIGMSASAATLAGNALGANLPRKAKQVVGACVFLNGAMWAMTASCTVLLRKQIAAIYTGEPRVKSVLEVLLCIFAVVGFFDSSQNVMGGALRGIGKQSLAACAYVVAFYGVMLPAACVAAFPLGFDVYGVWYSMGLGTGLVVVVFALALCRVDFRQLAAQSAAQMEREASTAEVALESAGSSKEQSGPAAVERENSSDSLPGA